MLRHHQPLMHIPVLKQYFSHSEVFMKHPDEMGQLYEHSDYLRRMDIVPWTLEGNAEIVAAGCSVPDKLELMNMEMPTYRGSDRNPLPAPQSFYCSGIRISYTGDALDDPGLQQNWMQRRCRFWIGQKVYHDVSLFGMQDIHEGVYPHVDPNMVPVILNQMHFSLELLGPTFTVPKNLYVVGRLHGFLARGVV